MTNHVLGEKTKAVIEQPLIAELITNNLLEQKDWMSVLNMRFVFRFEVHDDNLESCKKINESNKDTYNQYFLDHKIANYLSRIHARTTFLQRIRIHNAMFHYIIYDVDLFENSCFYDYIFDVLMRYIQYEPYYERHALVYFKILYPDTFYSQDFQETYDDHEHDLFDHDYD